MPFEKPGYSHFFVGEEGQDRFPQDEQAASRGRLTVRIQRDMTKKR
jgi:hypothetical protein